MAKAIEVADLVPYSSWRPAACDSPGLGLPEHQDWLVAPCSTNRDADCLQRANWIAQHAQIKDQPETDWLEASFNHWACGWVECCLVRPGTKAHEIAAEIACALADYPVVSESIWSDLEFSELCDYWSHMRLKERVQYCQRAGVSVFAARRDEVPERVYELLREC